MDSVFMLCPSSLISPESFSGVDVIRNFVPPSAEMEPVQHDPGLLQVCSRSPLMAETAPRNQVPGSNSPGSSYLAGLSSSPSEALVLVLIRVRTWTFWFCSSLHQTFSPEASVRSDPAHRPPGAAAHWPQEPETCTRNRTDEKPPS